MSKALATKNVAAALIGVGLVFTFVFAFATPAKADMLSDLQAQVNALLAQIQALQGGSSTSGGSCFTFTRNHQQGDTGGEVMEIQKFLNSHGAQIAASGAGSPGNETSYFGALTKAAVSKFQTTNGISPTAGYWGPLTRGKANTMCTGGTTGGGTTTPTGPGITVMGGVQPPNSLAPEGAIRVPFTTVTLTNNSGAPVTINGITVQRAGLGQDAVFSGIVLVDSNGLQVGIAKTLNSNHQAVVGDSWTLQPGQSQTLTVAGNMAAGSTALDAYAGQVVALSVVGINTTAPVTGSLPITGAQQTINATLSIGTVSANISSFDPNGAQSKNIGDTGIKFTGIRFAAGPAEDLKLFSIRWRMNGSASAGDLANLMTVVNGTSYPATVSADGRYVTSTFAGGILLQKGFSVDVYIQGDIVGSNSSGRVVEFDIDKQSDVYFVGQTFAYGVQMPYNSTGTVSSASTHATTYASSGNPIFQGSTFSITGASVTSVSKDTDVAAQNVAINVPNQPLGGFIVDLKGEPVSVQTLVFGFTISSADDATDITNVTLVDENGAVVAGPVDGTAAGADGIVTFSDTVTFQTGRHKYQLKGKLGTDFATGDTIVATTSPVTHWSNSTGQITGNSFTWTGLTSFSMSTMTVRGANLTVSLSSQPAAQNLVAGGQGVTFANILLDATQSGEDLRVSSLKLQATSTTNTWTKLTSCQLFDGTTALNTGSNVPTLASATSTVNTFTFDNSITVSKNSLKSLALKCNVASDATGGYQFSLTSSTYGSSDVIATGLASSNSVTTSAGGTITGGLSGLMTIASGSLVATLDSSSPSYGVQAAGTTGVTVSAFKLRPTNEAVWLNKLGLNLSNTASSSASDFQNSPHSVTVWIGGQQVGTATFISGSQFATSTLGTSVLLAKDVDTIVTIKADLAAQGSSDSGTPGHLIAVNFANAETIGQNSGGTIWGTGSTSAAGVRVFKSYPIITYSTTGATASNGSNDLLVLTVTAPSSGPVKLNKLTFTFATTTATLTAPTLTGPSGNIASSTNLVIALNAATSTATDLIAWFDSASNTADAEISAGTSKTYTLRGTLTLTGSNTTGSISIALKGDAGYPSLASGIFMDAATASSLGGQDIVWSPMTTTSPVTTANDWTNGYGLGGCYATAGLGLDCGARVIAK